ncbi:MAG: MBL fold metallo-hydrolase [Burkholderiaceae bacterium]
MTQPPLTPRPAATIILVRDTPDGMEVLMLQRTHQAAFIPGGYVFPGGAVDPDDSDPAFLKLINGVDATEASRILDLDGDGLTFWIAALRECFEEAGVLLAYDGSGRMVEEDSSGTLDRARWELDSGQVSFIDLCRRLGVQLAIDRMHYFAHWITQLQAPRRFTTRFFAAVAPAGQFASHDRSETIDHVWIRPADALARERRGEMRMVLATLKTLEMLAQFDRTEGFIDHVRTIRSPAPLLPRFARRAGAECILLDGDPAYAEIGKLDLTGTGMVSCEIMPGEERRLSDRVRRLTASNDSFMTGPGTNSYVLGMDEEFAVIDPGPADDAHIERLLGMTGGRIRWILVTHTHLDHSPAAARLRQRTGAQLLGMHAHHPDRQDQGFQPDIIPNDGQILEIAGCRVRVIHTPGHASNHFCYLLEDENMLFTGDHIMQGSTVVINPPDGDMDAYLRSLQKLKELNVAYLAPGHGFLMDNPDKVINGLVHHRLKREHKILACLLRLQSGLLEDILPHAYDDVPEHKHRAACRSLLAHLIKLESDGRVKQAGGRWTPAHLPSSG